MIASPSQNAELEQFFKTASVPKVLKINAATTFNDVPAFIQRTLENLKKPDISEAALRPRFDDVLFIKQLLEATQSEVSP